MRVNSEVKVGHHAGDIFTIQIVVGSIDVPHTPIGVVVTVCAGAEWSFSPQRGSSPVVIVMAKNLPL